MNAAFFLDTPQTHNGGVDGRIRDFAASSWPFRRLFHKSELVDRIRLEHGALRKLMKTHNGKQITLTQLRRASSWCWPGTGLSPRTLRELGISPRTIAGIIAFAEALSIPDPNLEAILDAYSRELVTHDKPLAVLVNGVTLPGGGSSNRIDVAVVLQIASSTEIDRKDIVVSYQRDVRMGDPLNFSDVLVYFDPHWDQANPVEFRVQVLNVSAERNDRARNILDEADRTMSSISGLVPHPAIPGVAVAIEAAKLIFANAENKVLLDYRVQFHGERVLTGSNGADIGLLRRGSWVVIGKPTEAPMNFFAKPMYKHRVTGEIFLGPLTSDSAIRGRGIGIPSVDLTISTADVQVPMAVLDRSDQFMKLLATRGKNDLTSLIEATHALNSSVQGYSQERRLKKYRNPADLGELIALLFQSQPGKSKAGQVAPEQLQSILKTVKLALGDSVYREAIAFTAADAITDLDRLNGWWDKVGRCGRLAENVESELGFQWEPERNP